MEHVLGIHKNQQMQAIYEAQRYEAAEMISSILRDLYAQEKGVTVSGVMLSEDGQASRVKATNQEGDVLFDLIVMNRTRKPDVIRFHLFAFSETEQRVREFYCDVISCYRTALRDVIDSALAHGCTLFPVVDMPQETA